MEMIKKNSSTPKELELLLDNIKNISKLISECCYIKKHITRPEICLSVQEYNINDYQNKLMFNSMLKE